MKRARPLVAAISVTAIVAGVLTGTTASTAAWTDTEFVNADVAALDCATADSLASRATGRMVAARIVGVPLDPIAALSGVVVTNDGNTVNHTSGAVSSGPDAWGAAVLASAIGSLITAGIGATLPLNWGTGTYNQYGQAHDSGVSTGAAGAVTSSGAIDTGAVAGGTAAKVGTLRLSDLTGLGSTLAGLADVALEVGAVASVATLDGCPMSWSNAASPAPADIERSYLVSALDARFTSPAVGTVFGTTVPALVNTVTTQTNTLLGAAGANNGTAETSVANAALSGLTSAVTGILGNISILGIGLGVDAGSSTAGITINLAPTIALLTGNLTDGVVTTNLATGAVTVNIAALTGTLENRPANYRVLTAAQLDDVTARVKALLDARVAQVNTALALALDSAVVTVTADLKVTTQVAVLTVAALNVHVGYSGTLKQFRDGTATITGPTITALDTSLLGGLLNLVTAPLNSLLPPLVNGVVRTAVVTALNTNLFTPVTGTIATVLSGAQTAVNTATAVLDPLLDTLAGILNVTLNARPDAAPFPAPPYPAQSGELFESAVRINVLGALAGPSILTLHLANASVGANGR